MLLRRWQLAMKGDNMLVYVAMSGLIDSDYPVKICSTMEGALEAIKQSDAKLYMACGYVDVWEVDGELIE